MSVSWVAGGDSRPFSSLKQDFVIVIYAPGHPVTESLLLAGKKGLRNGVQEKDNLQ